MHKSAIVIIGALFVGAWLVGGFALRAFGKATVTGKLIDMACYSRDKENIGNHHKNRGLTCARACAIEGFPVGLLTADGKVYQVMGDLAAHSNAKLVPHMTQTVTLTGDLSTKDSHTMIVASDLKMVKP